jgi:hypothetical protein
MPASFDVRGSEMEIAGMSTTLAPGAAGPEGERCPSRSL